MVVSRSRGTWVLFLVYLFFAISLLSGHESAFSHLAVAALPRSPQVLYVNGREFRLSMNS